MQVAGHVARGTSTGAPAGTSVTVIGCSGSVVGPDVAGSCYRVSKDGYTVLLDVGSGAASPMQRLMDLGEVDAVFISHAHRDHWADLDQLAYLRHRAGCPPIPLVCPEDLPDQLDFAKQWSRVPAREGRLDLGPLNLRLARVPHTAHSWAVRVGNDLCYTGDTAYCAEVVRLARGVRVLLAEASPRDDSASPGHLSAGDAGRLARSAGARLLVLTHLRPWLDPVCLLEDATASFDGPTVAAAPGLRWLC